jgi:hypothetical protein
MWKETDMTVLRYYPGHREERLRNDTVCLRINEILSKFEIGTFRIRAIHHDVWAILWN